MEGLVSLDINRQNEWFFNLLFPIETAFAGAGMMDNKLNEICLDSPSKKP